MSVDRHKGLLVDTKTCEKDYPLSRCIFDAQNRNFYDSPAPLAPIFRTMQTMPKNQLVLSALVEFLKMNYHVRRDLFVYSSRLLKVFVIREMFCNGVINVVRGCAICPFSGC